MTIKSTFTTNGQLSGSALDPDPDLYPDSMWSLNPYPNPDPEGQKLPKNIEKN